MCILREKIVQDWKANIQSFILNTETLNVKSPKKNLKM